MIRAGAFGGTYFRNWEILEILEIYSDVTWKWYKKSWKEFDQLKVIDQKFYCWDYYDASSIKFGVKCGTSLRFLENKGWISEIDLSGLFRWYFRYWLGKRSQNDERKLIDGTDF